MLAGHSLADCVCVVLAALFAVYTLLLERDFSCFKEPWMRYACALWIYLVARSLFTAEPGHALAKSLPAIRFMIFTCCVSHIVSQADKRFNQRLLISVCVALGFLLVDCLIQFFVGHDVFGRPLFNEGSFYRLTGPFSKRVVGITIAFFATIVMPELIYSLLKKYWLVIPLLAICLVLMMTGERSALLQFVTSLNLITVILLFKYRAAIPTKTIVWAALCITAGIALVCAIMAILYPEIIERQIFTVVKAISNYKTSHHIYLWLKGIEGGLSSIIFGIGPNHFEAFCEDTRHSGTGFAEATMSRPEFICSYHPHNIYIESFAEGGMIALCLMLLMLYEIGKKIVVALKNQPNIFMFLLILGTSMAAFQKMLPFLPSSGFFKSWFAVPVWFAIGLALGLAKQDTSHSK
jgi:O-antigen ligase